MAAPKRRGVKRRARFCVKNGRLSERSEFPSEASFLPFSKNTLGVAPEIQRLIFSFGIFSFASRQKKSTQINYHLSVEGVLHDYRVAVFIQLAECRHQLVGLLDGIDGALIGRRENGVFRCEAE